MAKKKQRANGKSGQTQEYMKAVKGSLTGKKEIEPCKPKTVKAKIKPDANVLDCIPKVKLKQLDIFKNGCLLHFTGGNWGAKENLRDDEYGDLPKEIVRGWKFLMSQEPLKEIGRIKFRAWRAINYFSLPFRAYKGMRYIPKDNIEVVNRHMQELEDEYWNRVDYFIDYEFDRLREDMQRQYPKFYDVTAYPDKLSLRRKFHWDLDLLIATTPDKESGVLSVEQYNRQVEKEKVRIKAFFNDALLIVSAKFLELTTKLRNKLVNKETFKTSTIENLEEFIDAFPSLNVTGNKQLADLVKTCKGYLKGVDAEVLRDNERFAAEVGKNMKEVVKEFGKLHDGRILRAIDI